MSRVLLLSLFACTEYDLKSGNTPDHPSTTGGGSVTETTPAAPGTPGSPGDPGSPDEPQDPTDPGSPGDPNVPVDSGDPTVPGDDPDDPGLDGGHFDVDTSSFISEVDHGTTDGHVHEYDDKFDVLGVDWLAPLDNALHPLAEDVVDDTIEFVIVVANPDHSPGARLVIDEVYDAADLSTWVSVGAYAATPTFLLPRHTIADLEHLEVWFDAAAIPNGDLVPTVTGCVRDNVPGPAGEWRNGALVLQAIRADTLATDLSLTAGGVHGVATDGLLWEGTLFWHWDGECLHEQ